MKLAMLAAALMLAPCALAQPPGAPAPQLALNLQDIGAYSDPTIWVSSDLLLLGRPPSVEDNSALWFWSRTKGAFEVKLPANARPERNTLCAKDGVLQWLEPKPEKQRYSSTPLQRKIFRLTVDPHTGLAKVDDKASALIVAVETFPGRQIMTNPTHRNASIYFAFANCPILKLGDILSAGKNIPEFKNADLLNTVAMLEGFEIKPDADFSGNRATGANAEIAYLDWNLKRTTPFARTQPVSTAFGELKRVDIAKDSDPLVVQLQLANTNGRTQGIMTTASGRTVYATPSPNGCAVLLRTVPGARPDPDARPRPAPAPPPLAKWPQGLGPANLGAPISIVDLCSSENRPLIEASN